MKYENIIPSVNLYPEDILGTEDRPTPAVASDASPHNTIALCGSHLGIRLSIAEKEIQLLKLRMNLLTTKDTDTDIQQLFQQESIPETSTNTKQKGIIIHEPVNEMLENEHPAIDLKSLDHCNLDNLVSCNVKI